MGANTKIEWCDHTWNPWEGCTKVSPGCAHCYAEARNQRFAGGANWGKGAPRRRTSEANWRQPLKWNREAEKAYLSAAHSTAAGTQIKFARPRVFCASLADWLDDEVPIEWLADLLDLIRRTPNIDWLLLTKRPQNFRARISAAANHVRNMDCSSIVFAAIADKLDGWALGLNCPENVWIGTTVEDQKRADERIPLLLQIPARVRFLSCEPLLGSVDLKKGLWQNMPLSEVPGSALDDGAYAAREFLKPRGAIHWVICGGESGHGARPMHLDWARSLRDQCQAAGVPFFFKQWGEWMPRSQILQYMPAALELARRPKMPSAVMRRDGGIDESLGEAHTSNDADSAIYLVGKKAAGALLDGREWKQFPEVQP